MSQIDIRFFSRSLNRYTSFKMYIPDDKRNYGGVYDKQNMKILFILHGYTQDGYNWIPEYISEKYNFAVVIPHGENSFWLDGLSTGHKYCTYVGEELIDYIRNTFGLAQTAEDTAIMGYSMGGFGALHTAFAYPDTFGKVCAMSSALIVHEIAGMKDGGDNGVANYAYYHECFGNLDEVVASDNNPEILVKRLSQENKKIPQIYMACGTEDFLLENNRQFHKFLDTNNIPHVYLESGGGHDMTFWSEYVVKFTDMMFGK